MGKENKQIRLGHTIDKEGVHIIEIQNKVTEK